jgi:hypothetical protein
MLRRPSAAAWCAIALALATGAVGVRYNAWGVGGADSSGYANQAELWLAGRLTTPLPLAAGAPWPEPESAFAPLGFRQALTPAAMVPTYPPGLPLALASVQLVAGRTGTHLLVPALAALTVWLAFALGRRIQSRAAGLLAAAGVATSPILLRQATQIMSDVPAAAWWTAALAIAYRGTARAAIASGLASAAAVLTRPNLVPASLAVLALVLAVARLQSAAPGSRSTPARVRIAHAAWWLLGFLPGCLMVAVVHTVLYGSPLRSGYGSGGDLYNLANVLPNLHRYTSWLAETESPILALALLAGFVAGRTRSTAHGPADAHEAWPLWPLLAFVILVVLSYLPYATFDDWWYTRFLLPALPAAFVLAAATIDSLAGRVGGRWRPALVAAIAALVAWSSLASARSLGSFRLAANERRYADVAHALSPAAASRGVLVAVQHSGSLRYETGRPTLRWDFVPPDRLDAALAYIRSRGFEPFIVLDSTEEPEFKARFQAGSPIGNLDWPPMLEVRAPTAVRVFDPAQRAVFVNGGHVETRVVIHRR